MNYISYGAEVFFPPYGTAASRLMSTLYGKSLYSLITCCLDSKIHQGCTILYDQN